MRNTLNCLIALIASASMITPAHADPRRAAFGTSGDRASLEAGLFSGTTVRLAVDRASGKRATEVRLKLASHTLDRAQGRRSFGSGLELGAGRSGQPKLTIAGQPAKLAVSPDFERDNKIVYVVIALVVLGGAVLLLKSTGGGNPPG